MAASADDLRLEMARIRAGARGKAFQLKQETQQLLDWKYYVRLFPWGILGSALLAGYLLVPTRRSAPSDGFLNEAEPPRSPWAPRPDTEKTEETVKKAGLATAAIGFVGSLLYRAGLNYATRQVVQMLTARSPHSSDMPLKGEETREPYQSAFR